MRAPRLAFLTSCGSPTSLKRRIRRSGTASPVGALAWPGAPGFTLIEVLVALAVLALLTAMGWRALDGLLRVQDRTAVHDAGLSALQAGLGQWGTDLDALAETSVLSPVDFDGRLLRLTRRAPDPADPSLRVVAWTVRADTGTPAAWQRWSSPPVVTRGELRRAWQAAADWARAGDDGRASARVAPAMGWQVFYFRGNAWVNPLSSARSDTEAVAATGSATTATATAALQPPPDGVRLVLNLPAQGAVTRDWVRPTLGATP